MKTQCSQTQKFFKSYFGVNLLYEIGFWPCIMMTNTYSLTPPLVSKADTNQSHCSFPLSFKEGRLRNPSEQTGTIGLCRTFSSTPGLFHLWHTLPPSLVWGFPGDSAVEILPANAGDTGPIPGLGRSPEKEMAAHSSILAWEMPRTEEPGGLQSMGLQKSQTRLSD